ncbi:MAG: hypothetical protein HYY13_07400 [Nitrospirae bacterium]|nr:hypothetical protein [Nitrospirota bacterium]
MLHDDVLQAATLGLASLLLASAAAAPPPAPKPAGPEAWVDVPIVYRIEVLWFVDVGELSFVLHRGDQPGTYVVVSEARPTDWIRSITRFRAARYTANLRFDERRGRFTLQSVHEFVRRADRTREVRVNLGATGWTRAVFVNEEKVSESTGPLDPAVPAQDPVSAFYNFAIGVYGLPEPGRTYQVPILDPRGPVMAHVEMLADKDVHADLRLRPPDEAGGRVSFRGSFMELKVKEVEFVTDRSFIPLRAVVREAGYLGRIRAFRTAPPPP